MSSCTASKWFSSYQCKNATKSSRSNIKSRWGVTFGEPCQVATLIEPLEGCKGSIVRDMNSNILYFSDPFDKSLIRKNMTVFKSLDEGLTWDLVMNIDDGAVAYSSLQAQLDGILEILYERSDSFNVIFEPDEIVYYSITVN